MVVWATVYPVTKIVVRDVDPLIISLLRYVIGVVPMVPFFIVEIRKRDASPGPGDMLKMSFLGILGVTFFALFLFYGIKFSTASNGSLLANTQPIFTTLFAPLLISEKFSVSRIIGAFAGVVGIAVIVTDGNLAQFLTFSSAHFLGNLLLVGSAISISIYSIFLKGFVRKYGGLIPTFITMLSGSFFLVISILIFHGDFSGLTRIAPLNWLALLYVGIIGTAIVYLIFNRALGAVGVVRSTGFKLMIPLFGVLFSILMLGEKPDIYYVTGAVIVIASIYFIQKPPVVKGGRETLKGKVSKASGEEIQESVEVRNISEETIKHTLKHTI